MDILEKPSVKKKRLIAKILLLVASLIFGISLTVNGHTDATVYCQMQARAIQINAVISPYIEEYVDSDDYTHYYTFAEYTYQGKDYSIQYDSYSSYSKASETVGQTVSLAIDPQNPGIDLTDMKTDSVATLLFGAVFVGIGIALCQMRIRKYYAETYGWRRQNLELDVGNDLSRRVFSWISNAVTTILLFLAWWKLEHWLLLAGGCLFAVVMVFTYRDWHKQRRFFKDGQMRIGRDVLVQKEYIADSEGDSYILHYSNHETTWRRAVNQKVFDAAKEGDTIETVYLGDCKRPCLSFCNISQSIE